MNWGIVIVALVLLASGTAIADDSPSIIELYPNPIAHNDAGEYIIVHFPTPTNLTGWSLSDGETTVYFPPQSVNGTVTITTDPQRLPWWIDHPVVPATGTLKLANTEDHVALYENGTLIDTIQYTDAPSAHRYRHTATGWDWQHPAATTFPVTTIADTTTSVFVLPDNPTLIARTLPAAQHRLLLAGYTFASPATTNVLCDAKARGVHVSVLVDGSPVGGMSTHQRDALDELIACNVTVTTTGGEYSWFVYHHAKYAIVDSSALVLTENWKPSGTGGRANRGWGVLIRDPRFATALASVFAADQRARVTRPWNQTRSDRHFVQTNVSTATYPQTFPVQTTQTTRTDLVLAPDNAEQTITGHLDSATRSIEIQQVAIDGPTNPFLNASIHAAHRGVTVRLLLSSAWYAHDENRELAEWVNTYADTNNIPLEARLVSPHGAFEKTHTKGIIIDSQTVIIGSINWNNHSIRNNREVAVILHGDETAAYYSAVFTADWNASTTHLPFGFTAVTLGVITVSARYAHRSLSFQSE